MLRVFVIWRMVQLQESCIQFNALIWEVVENLCLPVLHTVSHVCGTGMRGALWSRVNVMKVENLYFDPDRR